MPTSLSAALELFSQKENESTQQAGSHSLKVSKGTTNDPQPTLECGPWKALGVSDDDVNI